MNDFLQICLGIFILWLCVASSVWIGFVMYLRWQWFKEKQARMEKRIKGSVSLQKENLADMFSDAKENTLEQMLRML